MTRLAERIRGRAVEGPIDDSPGRVLAQEGAAEALRRGDVQRALLVYAQLVEQYGDADSYLGLSRAALASGDGVRALDALRQGSRVLVERGRRGAAICLLEEALALAPRDLAIHRRLVAAHANAGDHSGAVREHARYIGECVAAGDTGRALDELVYGRATLGGGPELDALEAEIWGGSRRRADAPLTPASLPHPVSASASKPPIVASDADRASDPPRPAAADLRERHAAADCVRAARALIAEGKTDAAADTLVAYLARGGTGREVQRLLIEIEHKLGRADIANEKAHLLSRVLELDGDPEGAMEVERLALAS
jgi:tetratricopeptide (TPR) repeat protein